MNNVQLRAVQCHEPHARRGMVRKTITGTWRCQHVDADLVLDVKACAFDWVNLYTRIVLSASEDFSVLVLPDPER